MEIEEVKICQSCGMPMEAAEDFGTDADGGKNKEYCQFCWQDGEFTVDASLPEFIEMQVAIAVEKMGMDEAEAREVAETTLPELDRWRME
jgi:hypothetical protein